MPKLYVIMSERHLIENALVPYTILFYTGYFFYFSVTFTRKRFFELIKQSSWQIFFTTSSQIIIFILEQIVIFVLRPSLQCSVPIMIVYISLQFVILNMAMAAHIFGCKARREAPYDQGWNISSILGLTGKFIKQNLRSQRQQRQYQKVTKITLE